MAETTLPKRAPRSVYTSEVQDAIQKVYPFVRLNDPKMTLMVFGVGELYVLSHKVDTLEEAVVEYVDNGHFELQGLPEKTLTVISRPTEVPKDTSSGSTSSKEDGPQGNDEGKLDEEIPPKVQLLNTTEKLIKILSEKSSVKIV